MMTRIYVRTVVFGAILSCLFSCAKEKNVNSGYKARVFVGGHIASCDIFDKSKTYVQTLKPDYVDVGLRNYAREEYIYLKAPAYVRCRTFNGEYVLPDETWNVCPFLGETPSCPGENSAPHITSPAELQ